VIPPGGFSGDPRNPDSTGEVCPGKEGVSPGESSDPRSGHTDSADVPWAGRDLSPSGFEADTGAADPALLAALAHPGDDLTLMGVVQASRFVVPIVADLTEAGTAGALTVEKQVDMAAVTIVSPDGQRALPVFSGTQALAAWDPKARPVPVTPARAGQAAVAEGCDVIVVDVAGPATRVLRPSMVWALAQQRPWEPPHTDPFVARSVAAALRDEPDVTGHGIEEGNPPGEGVLGVVLDLRPGLAPEQVRGVATRVGERLATDGELRARIDGLAFRLR
jgi:SseB protein N-terminal domain